MEGLLIVGACPSNKPRLPGAVRSTCVLDARETGRLFDVSGEIVFKDLAMANGLFSDGNHGGGAVRVNKNSGTATFTDVLFVNNSASSGGAVAITELAPFTSFTRCVFTNCSARITAGGAISVARSESVLIAGCRFANNTGTSRRTNLYAVGWPTAYQGVRVMDSYANGLKCETAQECGFEHNAYTTFEFVDLPPIPGRRRVLSDCTACSCNPDEVPSAPSPDGPVAFLSSALGILAVCGASVLMCALCAFLMAFPPFVRSRKRQHLETNDGLEVGAVADTELASLTYRTGLVGARTLSNASSHARVGNRDSSAGSVWAQDDLFAGRGGAIADEDRTQALMMFDSGSAHRFSVINPLASPSAASNMDNGHNSLFFWNAQGTGGGAVAVDDIAVAADVEAAVSVGLESLATIELAVAEASSSGGAEMDFVLAEIAEARAAYINVGQLLEDQGGDVGDNDGLDTAVYERKLNLARERLRGVERSVTAASGLLGGSARTNLIDQILRVKSKLRRVSSDEHL